MTLVEGNIWTIEVPENASYILFTNGGDLQTWDTDFVGGYIYNGFFSAVYGTELNNTLYVTGDGVFGEWDPANANGIMTNNGNGTFTITFEDVEKGQRITSRTISDDGN